MPIGGMVASTGEAYVTRAVGNAKVSVLGALPRCRGLAIKRGRSVNFVDSGHKTAYSWTCYLSMEI